MRFVEGGPILPNELLSARDEGQVIFFCGAGVSLARARLPDFYSLADDVLNHLHAASNSRARAVIEASRAIKVRGVEGLIPADRAFSILEQEFDVARVRAAVADSLKPKVNDLSAHQALIDLSRGTDGEVRLVTTNFDRLFEACPPNIACHTAPDLPSPNRPTAFKGIMHLHGVLDPDGSAPRDNEFVISSADFGRAYLSEGWATRFIRSLMERYQIVFVGYTANDPPVQYLLEALNTRSATFQPMYALQAGDDDLARALWLHKGVTPIAFSPANHYATLWDTLFAWAERARDPRAWETKQLERAAAGPRALAPHERGIIAHIASYPAGARQIAKAGAALQAEWLCVFDPAMRYRTPSKRPILDESEVFDPFAAWGLDDDPIPPPINPGNRYEDRKVPIDAANLTLATRGEDSGPRGDARPGLLVDPSNLPERLRFIGSWMTQVAHEPIALWWAAGKSGVHPYLAEWLPRSLNQEPARFSDPIRRGWRDLLASWSHRPDPHGMAFYQLEHRLRADGWSAPLVRELARLRTAWVEVRQSWTRGAPPEPGLDDDLVGRDIRYPNAAIDFEVPGEWLELYLREFGNALERAVDLELERSSAIFMLGPLWRDEQLEGRGDVGADLTTLFRDWVGLLEQMLPDDPELVHAALIPWLHRSNAVATRLKIWSVSAVGLLTDHEAAHRVATLDDDGFWDRDHQRDLLHAIVTRWPNFQASDRKAIEDRILRGPDAYEGEAADQHDKRSAYYALERLHWLHANCCAFTFDFDVEVERLRVRCPEWNSQVGDEAADSTEMKVYTVGERTDFDALLGIPIGNVAAIALEMDHQRLDVQTVLRPFRGLSNQRPVRALAALRHARSSPSLRLWEDFLFPNERGETTSRLTVATACVLSQLAPANLAHILHPVARWIENTQAELAADAPGIEERLWSNLLGALEAHTELGGSAILTTGGKHDWLMEAINSPTGILARVAVCRASAEAPEGPLPARWIERLRRMIDLDGDPGRYAVVTANQNLNFLNVRASYFVQEQLLPFKSGSADDEAAFWAGVYRAQGLSPDLHRILNQDILEAARSAGTGRAETAPLAALLLRGWAIDLLRETGDAISSDTLRDVIIESSDEFRRQLLQITQRWWQESAWQERALELLQDVWPRQRVVRSAAVTDAIATLIVEGDDRLPELLAAACDLLEPLPGMAAMWSYDEKRLKSLATRFPAEMLEFLYRVLSEDAASWPYRIEGIVEDLETSTVAKDSRLQELRRRWSARAL
ncbi:SIR2 family protein [Gluconacetobacter azotocaptans]|uniref:SIR2 family protein n=1 Tax=Gluconacetobacter azotocaptans TaxID=142834 RepID=UPI00195B28CB|nr:SIR2 family protein [Gluconacetobacter azotocaptans]MBM9401094.1 SIR2 family protein [Gluconacetobacter azotocaptans]